MPRYREERGVPERPVRDRPPASDLLRALLAPVTGVYPAEADDQLEVNRFVRPLEDQLYRDGWSRYFHTEEQTRRPETRINTNATSFNTRDALTFEHLRRAQQEIERTAVFNASREGATTGLVWAQQPVGYDLARYQEDYLVRTGLSAIPYGSYRNALLERVISFAVSIEAMSSEAIWRAWQRVTSRVAQEFVRDGILPASPPALFIEAVQQNFMFQSGVTGLDAFLRAEPFAMNVNFEVRLRVSFRFANSLFSTKGIQFDLFPAEQYEAFRRHPEKEFPEQDVG